MANEKQNGSEDKLTLSQIRCSNCGRFLGFSLIINGIQALLCKNCKSWTISVEGEIADTLTYDTIYGIINNR